MIDFRILRKTFSRMIQMCYPNKRPETIIGNHLHFIQIPIQETVDHTSNLSEGVHITIRFNSRFKNII